MNCLIENEYIQGKKREKKTEKNFSIHKWIAWLKTNTKGKKTEKHGKNKLAYFITGGVINFSRELAYFIVGGFINAMWTL